MGERESCRQRRNARRMELVVRGAPVNDQTRELHVQEWLRSLVGVNAARTWRRWGVPRPAMTGRACGRRTVCCATPWRGARTGRPGAASQKWRPRPCGRTRGSPGLGLPLWVSRVGLTSCPSRPLYPEHRTFPDPVGTSHLGQKRTYSSEVLHACCDRRRSRPLRKQDKKAGQRRLLTIFGSGSCCRGGEC